MKVWLKFQLLSVLIVCLPSYLALRLVPYLQICLSFFLSSNLFFHCRIQIEVFWSHWPTLFVYLTIASKIKFLCPSCLFDHLNTLSSISMNQLYVHIAFFIHYVYGASSNTQIVLLMNLCTNSQTFSAIFLSQLSPSHKVIQPNNVSTLKILDYLDYPYRPYKYYCSSFIKDWSLCLSFLILCETNQQMIAYLFSVFLFITLFRIALTLFLFDFLVTFGNWSLKCQPNFLKFNFGCYYCAISCLKVQSFWLRCASVHRSLSISILGLILSFPIIVHKLPINTNNSYAVLSISCFQTPNFSLNYPINALISLCHLLTPSLYFLTLLTKYGSTLLINQNTFEFISFNQPNCYIYSPKTNIIL